MRPLPLIALALLAACKTAPEAAPPGEPQLASAELTVEQELSDLTAAFNGTVVSPAGGTLESAHYELVVDERTVASGEQALDVKLGAEPAAFTVKAHGPYFSTPPKDALPAGTLLAAVRGKLSINLGTRKVELDFAKAREIRIPQLPTVVMNEVDFARYAANEAGGTFYLGVKNPNPFTIHLNALTWAAQINGKPVGDGELGKGEQVAPASTGVFEAQLSVNAETYGAEVDKLIKTRTLPYEVKGELVARMFKTPYALKGDIKLNESK